MTTLPQSHPSAYQSVDDSYKQLHLLVLLAMAVSPRLHLCMCLVLDSSQCRSLVSCCLPCGIHISMATNSSLVSDLASSHSSMSLHASGKAHYADTLIAMSNSVSSKKN